MIREGMVVVLLAGCAQFGPQGSMTAEQLKAASDAGIVCIAAQGASGVFIGTQKGAVPKDTNISVEPGSGCKTTIITTSPPKAEVAPTPTK